MTTNTLSMLSQANVIGQGFNIYGSYGPDSVIRPLLDSQKAGSQTFTLQGHDYAIPMYVTGVESTSGSAFTNVGETRDEYQNKIAAHANVEGNYGAFSGEMQADFGLAVESSSQYSFAKYTVTTQIASLSLLSPDAHLSDFFKSAVAALPPIAAPGDLVKFSQFFEEFGVYYVRQAILGGALSVIAEVNKSSNLTELDISAMIKAGYDGLASSGSITLDTSMKAKWTSFAQNSRTKVQAVGGDVAMLGRLVEMDPMAPSGENVALVTDWLKSLQASPAIVDFQLGPIWELCGDKQDAVRDAWRVFGPQMRPRLVVQLHGDPNVPNTGAPTSLPTITLGNAIVPTTKPQAQRGLQAVILDKTDASTPDGVLFNRYYSFDFGANRSGDQMWAQLVHDLKADPSFVEENILVIATFNALQSVPPSTEAYTVLESAGAGPELARWESHVREGGSNCFPAIAYCLVGIIGSGANAGVEAYRVAAGAWNSQATVDLTLETYLYRNQMDGPFSIGLASIS